MLKHYPLVDKHAIREALGLSPETLKKWRLGRPGYPPRLIEGIHWIRVGTRDVRYNLALIHDHIINQRAPELHQQAIEHYLGQLPSSQRKRLRRQSSWAS